MTSDTVLSGNGHASFAGEAATERHNNRNLSGQARMRRLLQVPIALAASGGLAGLLAATIYWSAFDARWIPFLGGVLFSAMVALGSHAARALWLLQRRNRQLERTRKLLAEETDRSRVATEAFCRANERLHAVVEAVPFPLLYVDADERCRLHNHSLARKLEIPSDRIEGRALSELLPEETYIGLVADIAAALGGKPAQAAISWHGSYRALIRPFPAETVKPLGVYVLFLHAPDASTMLDTKDAVAAASSPYSPTVLENPALSFSSVPGANELAATLAAALNEDRFLLLQQRIAPLGNRPQPGFEILLRLREEEDNLLPPGSFLPAADACGMMTNIDRWVVAKVIERCRERKLAMPGWPMPVYWINLSAAALQSPEFARSVQRQLQVERFDGSRLCFEIAERDMIEHRAAAERLTHALRPLGCRFAIDGFGAGNPVLEISGLNVDFVKIDGSIVQKITRNPLDLARVKAIHGACRQCKVSTVAQMVEELGSLAALREIGVDYVQGFGIAGPEPLFSEPLALADAA